MGQKETTIKQTKRPKKKNTTNARETKKDAQLCLEKLGAQTRTSLASKYRDTPQQETKTIIFQTRNIFFKNNMSNSYLKAIHDKYNLELTCSQSIQPKFEVFINFCFRFPVFKTFIQIMNFFIPIFHCFFVFDSTSSLIGPILLNIE